MGLLPREGDALWPSIRAILGSLCIHWGMLMVVGLRLENVSVPPSGKLGESITLGCDYSLESDKLLSLKWYRDGHEFFRYFPGNAGQNSPFTTFPAQGISVDMGEFLRVHHGNVRIRLKDLNFDSRGTYRCEISADYPTFQTLHGEGNLSIVSLPPKPRLAISGFPSTVQYADKIRGNCTFTESFPEPEMNFYLNNYHINKSSDGDFDLIRYPPVKVGDRSVSTLGLWLRVAPKHFQTGTGIAQIKCEAKLFDQKWETSRNITHQNYQTPFYPEGQNRYSDANGTRYSLILMVQSFATFLIALKRMLLV